MIFILSATQVEVLVSAQNIPVVQVKIFFLNLVDIFLYLFFLFFIISFYSPKHLSLSPLSLFLSIYLLLNFYIKCRHVIKIKSSMCYIENYLCIFLSLCFPFCLFASLGSNLLFKLFLLIKYYFLTHSLPILTLFYILQIWQKHASILKSDLISTQKIKTTN